MNKENSSDPGLTAIVSTDLTCNLISFPRSLSYHMVPTCLEVNDNSVCIGDDIDIVYHDGHDSAIYIPYKIAHKLDSEITINDNMCIEHVHVLGASLTVVDMCANHKELQYSEWNNFKISESSCKVNNQFTKYEKGLIVIPKKLHKLLSYIQYIGYFNYDGTAGKVYPTRDYDMRISTVTGDNTLYISPDLANHLAIPQVHVGQLLCFGTKKKGGEEMDIKEETKNEPLKHFQLPTTSILNKSIGEESQVILSIPFPYFMTIKPLFYSIVDGLKGKVENSIIKNVELNTTIAGHVAGKSGSINKIELNRTYFEDVIIRASSAFTVASGEIHFMLNNRNIYNQFINIDPDGFDTQYTSLFEFCEEYIAKWIKNNNIKAVIKLGDIDLKVDKLQMCNAPIATLEVYNMEAVTNSITSDLDLINVDITQA